ncbi:MAG: type II toxin-antitoxin system RelE/ParE family toxin [Candidatus Omnitrophica bacterium]|nr:type II toxin-antitoxin system RelE/ParE family toxin [Candidatus Omnitrophota bacterium]
MAKTAIYYQDKRGKKPVKEFINKLDVHTRAKVLASTNFLCDNWKELKRPIVEYLGDDLYELRVQFSSNNVRVFYGYMFKDYIVLLHGILKKTSKISENDKLKAKKRMIDFQIQYNEGKIKLK